MQTNKRNEQLGALCVIASAVLFGIMPMLTKIAYKYGSNAFSAAFGRFLLGSLFLWIIICIIPGCSIRITRLQLWELIKLSFFYALMPILLYCSYNYIDSGLATTLHFTYPVVVVLIMALFCRAHLNVRQILCTVISVCGIALLYTPDGQVSTRGILLAIVSGVVYAVYIVLLGKGRVNDLHPMVLTFWIAAFSTIEIGIIGLFTRQLTFHMAKEAWIAEILLALLTTVLALMLFQRGVRLCGEIKASLLSSFEPLTGIVIGILVFHENLTGKESIGIICILIAAIVLVLPTGNTKN